MADTSVCKSCHPEFDNLAIEEARRFLRECVKLVGTEMTVELARQIESEFS